MDGWSYETSRHGIRFCALPVSLTWIRLHFGSYHNWTRLLGPFPNCQDGGRDHTVPTSHMWVPPLQLPSPQAQRAPNPGLSVTSQPVQGHHHHFPLSSKTSPVWVQSTSFIYFEVESQVGLKSSSSCLNFLLNFSYTILPRPATLLSSGAAPCLQKWNSL